ncbi:hypothetical protein [Gorillibacterium timonense]|uniref:hypothetical protein n=1 Tax=Gorillibacterium timonense TaxID=1689269 RepID=UPI0011DDFE68|nr:hypothetical protein [Gorillibacterium timonense]
MTRRCVIVIGLLLSLTILAGCSNGTMHLTVNRNGSIDLSAELLLNSKVKKLVGDKLEEQLASRLEGSGIELKEIPDGQSTRYQFTKTYSSFESIQSAEGLDLADTNVQVTKNWLYTKYDIHVQPKMDAYVDQSLGIAGTNLLSQSVIRLLMKGLAFDFKLTLPYNLYGANNADEQSGRTLTWHVALQDSNPIQLALYVPNIRNDLITAGGLVLILGIGVIGFVRYRKR